MVSKTTFTKWYKQAGDLQEEISAYLENLKKMEISKIEKIPGYDIRLHQHIEAVGRSLEGVVLLMDQINCDIKTKKYTGEM